MVVAAIILVPPSALIATSAPALVTWIGPHLAPPGQEGSRWFRRRTPDRIGGPGAVILVPVLYLPMTLPALKRHGLDWVGVAAQSAVLLLPLAVATRPQRGGRPPGQEVA